MTFIQFCFQIFELYLFPMNFLTIYMYCIHYLLRSLHKTSVRLETYSVSYALAYGLLSFICFCVHLTQFPAFWRMAYSVSYVFAYVLLSFICFCVNLLSFLRFGVWLTQFLMFLRISCLVLYVFAYGLLGFLCFCICLASFHMFSRTAYSVSYASASLATVHLP
jgi:hypothetical protein